MNAEQKEIYADLVREFRELEMNGEKYSSSRLMQLRQIANHPLLYRRHYHDDKVIQIAKVLCAKVYFYYVWYSNILNCDYLDGWLSISAFALLAGELDLRLDMLSYYTHW